MFTNTHLDKVLNLFRGQTYTAPATMYLGQLTSIVDPKAGNVMEASYAGYARVAVTFAAPVSTSTDESIANAAEVVFPSKTDVGTVTIYGLGVYDAATAGNLLDVSYLGGNVAGSSKYVIGEVTAAGVTGDLITSESHGFVDGDRVTIGPFPGADPIPAGLTAWADYWIVQSSAHDFKLSTAPNGTPVDITGVGSMMVLRVVPVDLGQGDSLRVAAGALVLHIR